MARILVAVLFAKVAGGFCGGVVDDDVGEAREQPWQTTTLDCAWARGDNCWKQLLAASAACLPDAEETGELDGSSCVYESGTRVSFAHAVDPETACEGDLAWSLDIETGGAPCLSFTSSDQGFALTSPAGVFRSELLAGTYRLTCPDGTAYETTDVFGLFECLGDLPGTFAFCSGGEVTLGLTGNVNQDPYPLLDCRAPAAGE